MLTFPKTRRLLTSKDYRKVFAKPKKVRGKCLALFASSNGLQSPRLGLIIAKKHIPRAVDRNRIKRIVRESFRKHEVANIDVAFIAYKGLEQCSFAEIEQVLREKWLELNTWHAKQHSV